jgi:glycerophosphoryl diester phosphodiesterase
MFNFYDFYKYNNRPIILAHRGSQIINKYPENSIPAFEEALYLNADGFELDVILTRDRELVVVHDLNLFRLTGENVQVSDLTLEEITKLNLKSVRKGFNIRVPSLEKVFSTFGKQAYYNIEIKKHSIKNYSIIADRLMNLTAQFSLENKVWLSSFDPIFLWLCYRKSKHIMTALLLERISVKSRFLLGRKFISAIHPAIALRQQVNLIKKYSKPLCFWSVNNIQELKILKKLNILGIITDNIKLAGQIFGLES